MGEIGDQGPITRLIDKRSDEELLALMSNLGGHDMASMLEAFDAIDHDRPVCFIAYTIKGVGLPFQGHKDNHAGLMTVAQMEKKLGKRAFAAIEDTDLVTKTVGTPALVQESDPRPAIDLASEAKKDFGAE